MVGPEMLAGGPGEMRGPTSGPTGAGAANFVDLKRYDFVVQFCWRPGVDLRPAEPAEPAAEPAADAAP